MQSSQQDFNGGTGVQTRNDMNHHADKDGGPVGLAVGTQSNVHARV